MNNSSYASAILHRVPQVGGMQPQPRTSFTFSTKSSSPLGFILILIQAHLIASSLAASSSGSQSDISNSHDLHSLHSDGYRFSTKIRNNQNLLDSKSELNMNANHRGIKDDEMNNNPARNSNPANHRHGHGHSLDLHRGRDGYYRYGKQQPRQSAKPKQQQQQQQPEAWNPINDSQELQGSSEPATILQNQNATESQLQMGGSQGTHSNEQSFLSSTHKRRPTVQLNQLQIHKQKSKNPYFGNPTSTQIPSHLKHQLQRRIHRGRITTDFGTPQSQFHHRSRSLLHSENSNDNDNHNDNDNANIEIDTTKQTTSQYTQHHGHIHRQTYAKLRIATDANAILRLIPPLFFTITTFLSAFTATLRLLAPLVISKRLLCSFGNLISDWCTGRYFRKTYSRIEKIYIHYYETPATFRALSRTFSQWTIYLVLAKIMGYLVGITHAPCHSPQRGLAFPCGLLWIGSVVGAGHAFAEAVARWGGPLRLQAAYHPVRGRNRFYMFYILTRPWQILQWMQNPEQWISLRNYKERRRPLPFDPNPFVFPATWIPLRLLQMVALAKVAATEPEDYLWCPYIEGGGQTKKLMRKYLLQLALCDEWYRVFFREKRVGLGIFVAAAYYFSMLNLLVSSAMINGRATLLMLPSLLAIIVSAWMNIALFWNRYETRRGQRGYVNSVNVKDSDVNRFPGII